MRWPAWLGVGERRWKKSPNEEVQPPKTAWDFLQLLIVPAILVVIALAFNAAQASRERSREDRRIREDRALAEAAREDAILDAYLAKMSGLMLDRHLTSAKERSAVRQVARTATLTTLRRLDGRRRGEVVRFLYEARLLGQRRLNFWDWRPPVINLEGADLRGVDLSQAFLATGGKDRRISLSGDLRGASFDHAELHRVVFGELQETNLRGASFTGASLREVSLDHVDLRGVSFKAASLSGVSFDSSDLRGSTFDNATFVDKTSFNASCLTDVTFARASFNSRPPDIPEGLFTEQTTVLDAMGHDVDFSNAVNLSSVRLSFRVTEARFEGAKERPKRFPRSRTHVPDENFSSVSRARRGHAPRPFGSARQSGWGSS
jgi:uncharacterized protein YjbI with pentapeptide repeats